MGGEGGGRDAWIIVHIAWETLLTDLFGCTCYSYYQEDQPGTVDCLLPHLAASSACSPFPKMHYVHTGISASETVFSVIVQKSAHDSSTIMLTCGLTVLTTVCVL